jgi:C4-dicarboxylate transporter DctM subunit
MVEPLVGGVIGVIILLILLFMGVPIFVCLGFSGLIGIFLIEGSSGVFSGIGSTVFDKLWKTGLLAVPVFVFMGNMVFQFRFGADLYDAFYKNFGRMVGGLAIVSTVVSAVFGFMCGSGIAGTATIGNVALPEMLKRGYNKRLALGTLALAGGLSSLIPPSILMIIYGILTEVSIGQLFIAGIFPGFLLTLLMSIYIYIRCSLNPELGPKGDIFHAKEKVKSLAHVAPIIFIFFVVLGGIYAGMWSPSEAGGAGCILAFLLTVLYRRFDWNGFKQAAIDAGKTAIMIYLLVVGASIISLMFFISGFDSVIKAAVIGSSIPRWGIIVIMVLILTVMGCFVDVMGMLLITIPIFFPIIVALGYSPIWFGVIMVVCCELGMITPPVGIHLFVIQGIAPKGTTLTDVAMGALPYVIVIYVLIGFLLVFPDIAMWLPDAMMRI